MQTSASLAPLTSVSTSPAPYQALLISHSVMNSFLTRLCSCALRWPEGSAYCSNPLASHSRGPPPHPPPPPFRIKVKLFRQPSSSPRVPPKSDPCPALQPPHPTHSVLQNYHTASHAMTFCLICSGRLSPTLSTQGTPLYPIDICPDTARKLSS